MTGSIPPSSPGPTLTEPAPSEPAAVPWGPRDIWIGLGLLALWIAFSFAGAVLIAFLDLKVDAGLLLTLLEALLILPAWALTVRKYRVGWQALGFRHFRFVMVLLGFGLLWAAFAFNFLYGIILWLLGVTPEVNLTELVSSLDHPWLLVLGAVVVAPLVEEIFFRGFVFAGLRGRYGWVKAALISAALFSVIHLTPTTMLPVFVLGLFFAFVYQQSGSLWPSIAMHAAFNGISLGLAYYAARMGMGS